MTPEFVMTVGQAQAFAIVSLAISFVSLAVSMYVLGRKKDD